MIHIIIVGVCVFHSPTHTTHQPAHFKMTSIKLQNNNTAPPLLFMAEW